jgi:hypothetical protein
MNLDFDAWLQFLQDHWLVVAAAILGIVVVVKLVKTVLKWVLVAAIVVGIATYGGYTVDDLKSVGSKVTEQLQDQAIKSMAGEAAQATYEHKDDGSFTIKTPSLELTGVPNSGEVDVKLHGVSLGTWKMEGAVRDFVVKARDSAK